MLFGSQDGLQNDPRSLQDSSKTILERCLFRVDLGLRFWLVWGSILAPFGRPFGSPNQSFLPSFFDDFCMSFQDRPKSGQEPPRAPQEPPKSAQERPKRSPRAAKSGPRAPKSGPRAAKRGPRPAKSEQTSKKHKPRKPSKQFVETGGRKESEKITRAVQAKQAATSLLMQRFPFACCTGS